MKSDKDILIEIRAIQQSIHSVGHALWARYDNVTIKPNLSMDMLTDLDDAREALASLEETLDEYTGNDVTIGCQVPFSQCLDCIKHNDCNRYREHFNASV